MLQLTGSVAQSWLQVAQELEDLALVHNMVHVLHLRNVVFQQDLERALALLHAIECAHDLAKVADAHDLVQVEVADRWLHDGRS